MIEQDPTKRFSIRAQDYVKYRPTYPTAVLECLIAEYGLTETAVITDIGSGTGLLSQLFLDNGNVVYGVEPNEEMRAAGEVYLAGYAHFHSVNGRAEATTLPDNFADFITAGQALHWFAAEPASVEFRRILKPDGVLAFLWNIPDPQSPLMAELDELLLHHYLEKHVREEGYLHRKVEELVGSSVRQYLFANEQFLDFAGFRGRCLSSSPSPPPGHPQHEPFVGALRHLFDKYAENGRVRLIYQTELYITAVNK
jgi:SAM-dependent methyltransferase